MFAETLAIANEAVKLREERDHLQGMIAAANLACVESERYRASLREVIGLLDAQPTITPELADWRRNRNGVSAWPTTKVDE